MQISSFRRNFYLLIAISVWLTLPWLGLTSFHTKGEPREAVVSQTMLIQNNWILPHNNGGEIAYKPPFMHWCIAAVSSLFGKVTEYSSRFPSAVGAILLILWTYFFFGGRRDTETGILSAVLCLTSFEIFRAAYACRVDMLLTLFICGAVYAFYAWSERPQGSRGVPWLAILMMSLGCLTKGPVAIVLPVGITVLWLLFRRERFVRIMFVAAGTALLSLVLPALWYWAAYQQGGDQFLALVREENLDRFLGKMSYRSHENGLWYYFAMLPAGLLPWSLLFLPALFRRWRWNTLKCEFQVSDPLTRFSMLAALTIFVFYCIPSSKRGVYIMPMYPFVAYLMAVGILRRWSFDTVRWMGRAVIMLYLVVYAVALPIVLNRKSDVNVARVISDTVGADYVTSYVSGGAPQNPNHFFTINFYMRNRLDVWRNAGPAFPEGYLVIGHIDAQKFIERNPAYRFELIPMPSHTSCDVRQTVMLFRFQKRY